MTFYTILQKHVILSQIINEIYKYTSKPHILIHVHICTYLKWDCKIKIAYRLRRFWMSENISNCKWIGACTSANV